MHPDPTSANPEAYNLFEKRPIMDTFNTPGVKVASRSGDLIGLTTGSTHRCSLEGCNGVRVAVKWPDGRRSYPCSKGLEQNPDKSWRID
jgi:hypothetical protein